MRRFVLAALLATAAVFVLAPSSSADTQVQGVAPVNSSLTNIRPVGIGAQDPTGKVQFPQLDANKILLVSAGINPFVEHPVPSGRKVSNGGTLVAIAAAGASGTRVYLCKLTVYNSSSTVFHTVQLCSSGGTVLQEYDLSARSGATGGGGASIVDDVGFYQSAINEGLSFKFTDGTGSAGDVIATGSTVTK